MQIFHQLFSLDSYLKLNTGAFVANLRPFFLIAFFITQPELLIRVRVQAILSQFYPLLPLCDLIDYS
jgi:hypothetical protein